MNKVLLFYPSFIINNDDKPLYTDIPLSVASLAAGLYNKYQVEIIDERLNNSLNLTEKLKDVVAVGISATTSNQITNGLGFAKKVREYNKDIKIIWGGWHPSLMPYETIKHELVDIVVIGQGERIFEKLIKCIANNENLDEIPNIIYKNNNRIIKTKEERFTRPQMPETMAYGYKCLDMPSYIHSGWGNNRILGYESSRGCPFSCGFCSINAVFKQTWTSLPAENVVSDIIHLKENYDIDAIHFFDNNYFVNKPRVFDIANRLKSSHLKVRWDGTVVTEQFLKFTHSDINSLKESGFYRVIAGIESGDDEVLLKINKRHKNSQVLELVKRCKDYDIMPSLSFIIGFPWNPEKDTKNTIRLIEEIKNINPKTEILLFIFSPYLGTPLYEIAGDYGMAFPGSLEGWSAFTYDKPNTPWIKDSLRHKMDRYLSFFGTKELSESENAFFNKFKL